MGVSLTANLRVEEDHNTGSIGIMFQEWEREDLFAVTTARMFSHDLIEHVNGPAAMGTLRDELEAIGACVFVRGLSGCDLKHDLQTMYEYLNERGMPEVETVEIDEEDSELISDCIAAYREGSEEEDEGRLDEICKYFEACMRVGFF